MKKTYEFETEPIVEYCIKVWTPKDKWKQGLGWTGDLHFVKNFCKTLIERGAIAKIVKRTAFHENYYWDEYHEWLQERKAEKEDLPLTNEQAQRLLKAIFAHTEGENDEDC